MVFEAEPAAPDVMRRPPRAVTAALFSRDLILPSVLQGLVVLAILLGVFIIVLARGLSEN